MVREKFWLEVERNEWRSSMREARTQKKLYAWTDGWKRWR